MSVFLLFFHIDTIRKIHHDAKVILKKLPCFSTTYLGKRVTGSEYLITGLLQSKYNDHLLLLMQNQKPWVLHIWNITVFTFHREITKGKRYFILVCISTLKVLEESAGSKKEVKFLLIRCYSHSLMMQEGKANITRNRAIYRTDNKKHT